MTSELELKLWMVLLGCRPPGRNTEQHDVFFGVAPTLDALVPQMQDFWPGVKLHIDAYLKIEQVGDYAVSIGEEEERPETQQNKLFFINLGGYAPPDFEEYHKKLLVVAPDASTASRISKRDRFYKEGQDLTSSSRSHIDDKFEVDELLDVGDLLRHRIILTSRPGARQSEPEIGYLQFSKLAEQ